MQLIDVHTPSSSFSIPQSLQEDNLQNLFDKLSRKVNSTANGGRVGPGWLKYHHGDSFWNLDDDSDYAIFVWRHAAPNPTDTQKVTIHMHSPNTPLPVAPDYQNPNFYAFLPTPEPSPRHHGTHASHAKSVRSTKSRKSAKSLPPAPAVAQFKQEFERFHSENGVRTVLGTIGPVNDVRMLLKNGYRHVYVSRAFAKRNNFIRDDAAPGMYGYTGLISIGEWPITVGSKTTRHPIYLSEESHFDVILGRSFMERRMVKVDLQDLTLVYCMDTGEKIDCEVVVIRDGKGEIVTVT